MEENNQYGPDSLYGTMRKKLCAHGLVRGLIYEIMDASIYDINAIRKHAWARPVTEFSAPTVTAIWDAVQLHAIEWLKKNAPEHKARNSLRGFGSPHLPTTFKPYTVVERNHPKTHVVHTNSSEGSMVVIHLSPSASRSGCRKHRLPQDLDL